MREKLIFLFFILFHSSMNAQENLFTKSDSLNTKRIVITSASIGTVWAGSIIGLQQIWYSNVTKSDFHTFNDTKNCIQMQKQVNVNTAKKIRNITGDF
jgi:pheromone shutdown protein TraB